MPLDSDVADADSRLTVEFYTHKRPPHEGRPFVKIMTPGDQTNIIDQPVREEHKRRFPRHWLYYQMQNQGDAPLPGTPLMDWHRDRPQEFTENQLAEMSVLKFQVVEQVANASDRQLERVGMGGLGLRERARQYLAFKNASGNASELEALRKEMAEMRAVLAEKNKGGRPRKDQVNVNNDNAATHAAGDG